MSNYDTYANTNIGKVRIANEDQAMVVRNENNGHYLAVVCDGMGGQNRGDYASKLATDMICDRFMKNSLIYKFSKSIWIKQTIRTINNTVFDFGDLDEEYAKMGTTLVSALLTNDKLCIANVGDSRAYSSTSSGIRQLTTDQTYVEFLYKTGQISKNEMESHPKRHILMNAIGSFPTVNIDVTIHGYLGETILLCSDGLYNSVSEREIWSILQSDETAKTKGELLIRMANSNGGPDNIAIAIIQKGESDDD